MLRVAILGAGFMGSTHARAFHGLPDVEVKTIYAHSDRRAAPLADEIGAAWTDDLGKVLTDPEIDAVSVCLPTPDHRLATESALEAGKHVLLEKPIALTDADARALVKACAETDRVVMVAHVLRFWPEYVAIREMLADGRLGRPYSAVATRRQPFPSWSPLFASSDLTGGAVIDMMIHDFDALNWLFGPPVSVTAYGQRNPETGGWDQIQALIDYGEDRSALVDGGMMMPESYPFSASLEILGDGGAAEYRFRAGGRSVEMSGGINELRYFPSEGEPQLPPVPRQDPYVAEVEYFIECIRTGQPATRATPATAHLALRTALAARASLESGNCAVSVRPVHD